MNSTENTTQMEGVTHPPGTVLLEQRSSNSDTIVLHPIPTDDPNDPLNWSTFRKSLNFGIACIYVTLTFVLLDNAYVAYEPYAEDLGVTYDIFNEATASNYAGLAIGSIFFIPFVHRYGRRPLYLASTLIQFAVSLWSCYMTTSGEVIATSFIGGLGGALSETIAIITIGDLFFLHHHALLNGIFLLMQSIGAFIGPVVMGYAVENLGWRWMWKITTIMIGVCFVLCLFFFEESKYVPQYSGRPVQDFEVNPTLSPDETENCKDRKGGSNDLVKSASNVDVIYRPRPYRQRMALITPTDEPIVRHIYQPVLVLFSIPAVFYAAATYGTLLAWISMMSSASSYFTTLPPYNLSPNQIGLLSLGPFVGLLIGSIIFPPISDWSIVVLSKRNRGIFEPEMRLWLALPGAFLCLIGLLVFGYCLGQGRALLAVQAGNAIFGAGFVICADVSLTYVLDVYQDIIGDSMVIIVFCRNIISVVLLFVYTPWVTNLGIQNTFLMVACFCITILLAMPIWLLIYGKKLRARSVPAFRKYASHQIGHRRQ